MRCRFVYVSFIVANTLLLSTCQTLKESHAPEDVPSLNSVLYSAQYPSNVYIGIAPKMSFKEKETEYAKLHIAHQIAQREACTIDAGQIFIRNGGDEYDVRDSYFDYDDTGIEEILEHIEIINTHRFNDTFFAIGRDTRAQNISNPVIRPLFVEERPRWIHDPESVRAIPGMESFSVGIGVAEKYSSPYKAFRVSDAVAAQQIAAKQNLFIETYLRDNSSNAGSRHQTGGIALSASTLKGFYIIDRWVEPDGSVYYSLALAYNNGGIK